MIVCSALFVVCLAELAFHTPVVPIGLVVFETYHPGTIVRILALRMFWRDAQSQGPRSVTMAACELDVHVVGLACSI